jgi:hypothetical protein
VDLENMRTAFDIWQAELDTTVETPRPEKSGVQSIGSAA